MLSHPTTLFAIKDATEETDVGSPVGRDGIDCADAKSGTTTKARTATNRKRLFFFIRKQYQILFCLSKNGTTPFFDVSNFLDS